MDEKLGEKRTANRRLISANPQVTVNELAAALHISRTAIDKNIQTPKSQGDLGRLDPAKGGYWEVKGTAS